MTSTPSPEYLAFEETVERLIGPKWYQLPLASLGFQVWKAARQQMSDHANREQHPDDAGFPASPREEKPIAPQTQEFVDTLDKTDALIERLEIMLCSAVQIVSGEEVVGYEIKTGALHSILGIMGGRVSIPLGLPSRAAARNGGAR